MTQYFARVVSGIVAEIIQLPDGIKTTDAFHSDIVASLVPATIAITPGQTYASGAFGPAPVVVPPVVIPASVSRRQFFQAAAQGGVITEDEALAVFATGAMPASLSAALATLPTNEQFAAHIAVIGNATFERSNPLIAALGTAMGDTSAQIDELFILAASL
jgi:hypothetical protein